MPETENLDPVGQSVPHFNGESREVGPVLVEHILAPTDLSNESRRTLNYRDTLCRHQVNYVYSPSALVIGQADSLRFSVVEFLQARGWVAHEMRRVEQARSILQCLPYDLVIIDAKFPCLFNTDFLRFLRNTIDRQAIPVFLITSSLSSNFAEEATEHGAFLARESTWDRALSYFLACLGFAHSKSIPGVLL